MVPGSGKLTALGAGLTHLRERRPSLGNMMKNPFTGLTGRGGKEAKGVEQYKFEYSEMAKGARKLWGKGAREKVAREFARGVLEVGWRRAVEREGRRLMHSFEGSSGEEQEREHFRPIDGSELDFEPVHSLYATSLPEIYSSSPSPKKPPKITSPTQENIWSQVERVFRNKHVPLVVPSPPPPAVPQVVEEPPGRKVPRVKWKWTERVTWLDEIIRVSNANYGGGDGGGQEVGGGKEKGQGRKGRKDGQDNDFKKFGEPWAKKRIGLAATFEEMMLKRRKATLVVEGMFHK